MNRRWNQMGRDFHPGRNNGRNFYRQSQGGNNMFPNTNFIPNWNPAFMEMNGFDSRNFQYDFRSNNRNFNKHHLRKPWRNSFGPSRRLGNDNEDCPPQWIMNKDDQFEGPINFKQRNNNKFLRFSERSRSVSPASSVQHYSDFIVRNNDSNKSVASPYKRTIHADKKREHIKLTWSSDSDSDDKEKHKKMDVSTPKPKSGNDDLDMIWNKNEDRKEESSNEQKIFKYSTETLPKFDGKTIVGDEGVFEMKVYRCTFCNIICLDKEKSRLHMLTKYHYTHYKNYLNNHETA